MPPKKQQGPNKKTVEKKKEKVIEDKTFGLKNKKGKKQQQFIKQVANQVKYGGGTSVQKRESMEHQEKAKKVEERKQKQEMDSLFRPAQQKVSAGGDPKSVLCLFYKQGQCKKGDKCKFSHDMSLEGKSEKRSMYVDARELEEDTIDKWDESKLKEVVQKKHGGKTKPKTDIVCKHFLQAIEKEIYGWFWECPNGDKCIYRHALPPGFVFKKIGKQVLQEEEKITIEELVEKERQQLSASGKVLTPVTLETFKAWKERKLKEKKEKLQESATKKKEAYIAGRTHGISGREMFEFNPELVIGDDQEANTESLHYQAEGQERIDEEEEEGEEEEEAVDITNTAGYSDELMPLPPKSLVKDQHQQADSEGAVGGSDVTDSHMAGDNEEIPIDEDLFAAEDMDENLLDIETLDIQGVDTEHDAIDQATAD